MQGKTYDWRDIVARVHFLGIEFDLCDLRTVYDAVAKIRGENGGLGSPDLLFSDGTKRDDGKGIGLKNIRIPRLDVLVCNAGIGGWSGLDWGVAVWTVLTNMPESVTWPVFKKARIGAKVRGLLKNANEKDNEEITQTLLNGSGDVKDQEAAEDEPVLGEVFCANVFGHYILGHELMPLLSTVEGKSNNERGRIVWVSSIEAQSECFDENDFQGLQSSIPYESSKRLTDILALTADLPAVRKTSASYFEVLPQEQCNSDEEQAGEKQRKPEIYLTHPGICATDIIALNFILNWAMTMAFYIARWMGSIWHPVSSYKGACAPVWVSLADQSTLDEMEKRCPNHESGNGNGKGKWGSSTDLWGRLRVRRTEVGGWGWSGEVGREEELEQERRGRKKGAVDSTTEAREEFEMLGERCWRRMEELRVEWEGRLGLGSGIGS